MNKGQLKSKLKFLILHHDPELIIQDSIWDHVYNFYLGYTTCFREVVKFPVEDSYALNFILEESFKYLLTIIEKKS